MKRIFLILLVFSNALICYTQQQITLYFHVDKISIKEKVYSDSTGYRKYKQDALEKFRILGYQGLEIADSTCMRSSVHYYFNYSHHFKKIILNDEEGKRRNLQKTRDFTAALFAIDKKIMSLENNGYPFSSIQIINQREEADELYLEYKIDSGKFYSIDEIVIKSQTKVHDKTILNLINIKPGDVYNESKIREIGDILVRSKLYKLIQPPQLIFRQGKADLYLFLEKSKSSNADGFVGFQQDNLTGKLALNGYVNLKLMNALNRAETIDLNWRNNPDKTQNLRTKFEYPYIFNSPFGVGSELHLQKQDTTFIKSDIFLYATYRHPQFTISLFDELERSDIITGEPTPGFRDYSKNTIGASFNYSPKMPDFLHFYHPGFDLMGGFFSYRSDTLDDDKQKIANNKYRLGYGHTFDFLKYFHLHNKLSFQGLTSSIGLSRNELIYFGGLKSVRGFYELELRGNDVWILNNELEFRPVEAISFMLLYDYSTFQDAGQHYTHSGGVGFNFFGDNFSLQLIFANGVLNENPLDLSNTKIHIGFTSIF